MAVELSRVSGSAPQLITIGADKTLAIWDTMTFKVMVYLMYGFFIFSRSHLLTCISTFILQELRRIKPVPKLACHSVASWCHPRAPNLDILTCVKDSHIWYLCLRFGIVYGRIYLCILDEWSNCLNFCRSIEHPTYSALTRPLCELSSLVPPQVLATHRKLRVISSLLMKSSKSTTYHIISFCLLVVYYINSSCSSLSMSIAL